MAQKTPVTALIVTRGDNWNSLWFTELNQFQSKLQADWHTRALCTAYLNLKRRWLLSLSLKESGGLNYLKLTALIKNFVRTKKKKKRFKRLTKARRSFKLYSFELQVSSQAPLSRNYYLAKRPRVFGSRRINYYKMSKKAASSKLFSYLVAKGA